MLFKSCFGVSDHRFNGVEQAAVPVVLFQRSPASLDRVLLLLWYGRIIVGESDLQTRPQSEPDQAEEEPRPSAVITGVS